MDPVIASAKSALEGIKAGLAVGRETEAVMGDLIKFVNSSADVKAQARKRASLSMLAKSSKTVEQAAVEVFLRKKAIEEMEDELRAHVCREYGANAWNEIMDIQTDIKKERAKIERKRLVEKWSLNLLFVFALAVIAVVLSHK